MKKNLLIIAFISIIGITPAQTPNSWVQKNDVGYNIPNGPTARLGSVSFSIGNKGYLGTGFDGIARNDFWEYEPVSNSWTQKADFGGSGRWLAVGFSIGSMGYIGTGQDVNDFLTEDFWEYNPGSNAWTQKANFGGSFREGAIAFSIGSKGYVGTGNNGVDFSQDLWEYDPSIDVWVQKADFGGLGRDGAVGFSIGSNGYVGTGIDATTFKQDFWKYNPGSDVWTQIANFGGDARFLATGFSIGTHGYITTGINAGTNYKDLWDYDSGTDTWTQKTDFGGASRDWATSFSIGSKGYVGTGEKEGTFLQDFWEYNPGANDWTQKVNFGGPAHRGAVGFMIGSKSYIGTGSDGANKKDFWEFEPVTNVWTQKADFGGASRYQATGFSIGTKGYIGTGTDGGTNFQDFWQYDPASNSWTPKADFGGTGRYQAVGFSIGSKGYIGTGYDGNFTQDFWEYDQISDTWTQKANFGGTARFASVGFSISSKGYLGTGYDEFGSTQDFWEYNPVSDTWTQKSNFGGTVRYQAAGFNIGNKGYIGTGYDDISNLRDFWEYDPATDTWVQKTDFGGTARYGAVGIGNSTQGYIGTGYDRSTKHDFWEYIPETPLSVFSTRAISGSPFCPGAAISIEYIATSNFNSGNIFTAQLSNANGSFSSPVNIGNTGSTNSGIINATIPTNTPSGIGYRIRVVSNDPALTSNDNGNDLTILDTPSATASPNTPICSGNTLNLTSSGGTNYSWTGPGGFTSASQNPVRTSANPAMSGSYIVTVSNSSGCTATATVNAAVTPIPGTPIAITGKLSVLRGGTYSYSVSITNSTTYIWTYSGNGATISGNTNPVTISFACNATNGNLTVRGNNTCGNGPVASVAITTNPGSTINIYSSKITTGSGHHPATVKTAIMPVIEPGSNKGFKVFRSNLIGVQAKRNNYSHIWYGDCTGLPSNCYYNPASDVTSLVTVTGPVLSNYGGSPSYKYVMTVPAGKRYLVIAKDDATQPSCSNNPYGVSPCYVYPGKRTYNRNNHHNNCDEDDDGDNDGDDDTHFQSCNFKDMFLQIVEDANGKIRPLNTDAIPGSLLLISSPDYMEFTDSVELLPIVYESVDGIWDISTVATPPEGFYSIPDTSIETLVTTSLINTLQFTLVDTGSVWTTTQVKTQLKHNGMDITHIAAPYMIDNKKTREYLSQNEPNPFNGSTSIPYNLPSASNVKLSIYDVYGREIAVLVNRTQQKGQYKESWNICENENCPYNTGIYFICLQATSVENGKTILNTKSMIYIK